MPYASTRLGLGQPAVYEIRLQGELDDDWADWLEDGWRVSAVAVSAYDGITTVTGTVADQPALHGLLSKVRDLGLALLSVSCVEIRQTMA